RSSSLSSALRASAHRCPLLFAQALIAVLCSSRKRSSLSSALRAGAHRCPLLFAQALIAVLCSSRRRSSPLSLPVVLDVALERPGRRELTELVPDHRLGDEHRDMLAAVVHRESVPDHVGDDRRAARPGLDDLLRVLLVLHVDLLEQMVVDERALLQAAWHFLAPGSVLSRPTGGASCRCAGVGR